MDLSKFKNNVAFEKGNTSIFNRFLINVIDNKTDNVIAAISAPLSNESKAIDSIYSALQDNYPDVFESKYTAIEFIDGSLFKKMESNSIDTVFSSEDFEEYQVDYHDHKLFNLYQFKIFNSKSGKLEELQDKIFALDISIHIHFIDGKLRYDELEALYRQEERELIKRFNKAIMEEYDISEELFGFLVSHISSPDREYYMKMVHDRILKYKSIVHT
jgi:hypothetical protein